ncbi:methylamine utilization protein [Synechococcus phage S-H25]|nr:methylamine utilization protein [Synechococcus phage S-H25]
MINYARHDEEFYGVFKLLNGEEVLGKAVLTEDNEETLVFIQNPVCTQVITKEIEGKTVRGVGFANWMQFSDEDFYIIREKDILTVTSMSREMTLLYEAFIMNGDEDDEKKTQSKIELEPEMGYLGKIDEARKLFERIYKS